MQCKNCNALSVELSEKRKQWREVESSMKATHEKEVETLKRRLKEEKQKNEEMEAELREAQKTINRLQENQNSLEASKGPVVAQTLERFIRGMLYS